MILILEDDADREQYQRVHPLNPEFLNPDTMRPATVWISTEAYEEKVRADERKGEAWAQAYQDARGVLEPLILADLRAKVEAVDPVEWALAGQDAGRMMLALIDGGSDE